MAVRGSACPELLCKARRKTARRPGGQPFQGCLEQLSSLKNQQHNDRYVVALKSRVARRTSQLADGTGGASRRCINGHRLNSCWSLERPFAVDAESRAQSPGLLTVMPCCSNPPITVHFIVRVLRTRSGPATARNVTADFRGAVICPLTRSRNTAREPSTLSHSFFESDNSSAPQ